MCVRSRTYPAISWARSIPVSYTHLENVTQASSNTDTIQVFQDTVDNMMTVVIVLILSAGLLAFVVLYNLTNINIGERVREIATLKVLGFTPVSYTHLGGHGQAQIGVDVDFADRFLGGDAQLVLRNAHGIRHFAAVLVDDFDKFLRHRGSAVQHDGERCV